MKLLREHSVSKITIYVLIAVLVLPYAVKFAHIFEQHTHKVCLGEKATHLHEIDLDCEFYKFKLTTNFTYGLLHVEFFVPKKESRQISSQYHFLSKYQRLHYSLRGPPSLI